jgi:predicted nucleotidyltransferase
VILQDLKNKKLIDPPEWVITNCVYLTVMGSIAYGVADTNSGEHDFDLYGICIPKREMLFPHLAGEIWGFGAYKEGMPKSHFNQWQKAHIYDPTALGGKGREYDFQIYNIVKYVQLCAECNPNMIDSLYTYETDVLHITKIGQLLRNNRHKFLHQGICDRFKGYAYAQVKKLMDKTPDADSKRYDLVQKHGYDTKFAYHIVRLLEECEQLLRDGDMDLKKNREMLKSIRRGDWKLEQIYEYFEKKRIALEDVRINSPLPPKQDWNFIRQLLVQCLEIQYGDIKDLVVVPDKAEQILRDIRHQLEEAGY